MYRAREQAVTRDARGHRKGIVAVAQEFKVSYTHLYLILKGKRDSARIMALVKAHHPELLEV
jgi:hypothetical protein